MMIYRTRTRTCTRASTQTGSLLVLARKIDNWPSWRARDSLRSIPRLSYYY